MPFPKGYGSLFTRVRGRTFPKVLYPVRAPALSGSFTSPSEPTRTAKGNCPIVATDASPQILRAAAYRQFARDSQEICRLVLKHYRVACPSPTP
jgi:hypothetical protein